MSQEHKVASTEVITCHYRDDEDAQAVLIIYSDGAVDVRCAMRASCDPCKYEHTGRPLLEREYLCESPTWCFGCRQPISKGDTVATAKDKKHRILNYHKACWDKKVEKGERGPKRRGSENVQGVPCAEVKGDSGMGRAFRLITPKDVILEPDKSGCSTNHGEPEFEEFYRRVRRNCRDKIA